MILDRNFGRSWGMMRDWEGRVIFERNGGLVCEED